MTFTPFTPMRCPHFSPKQIGVCVFMIYVHVYVRINKTYIEINKKVCIKKNFNPHISVVFQYLNLSQLGATKVRYLQE